MAHGNDPSLPHEVAACTTLEVVYEGCTAALACQPTRGGEKFGTESRGKDAARVGGSASARRPKVTPWNSASSQPARRQTSERLGAVRCGRPPAAVAAAASCCVGGRPLDGIDSGTALGLFRFAIGSGSGAPQAERSYSRSIGEVSRSQSSSRETAPFSPKREPKQRACTGSGCPCRASARRRAGWISDGVLWETRRAHSRRR